MEAYPLHWPLGYKRTETRIKSLFKESSLKSAQSSIREEIRRLGGQDLVINTNLPVLKDGILVADWMKRKIDDPGVAIYFKYQDKPISMCCDKYSTVGENIYALAKGIEALRGLDRWGVSDFLDRVFTGFQELPEHAGLSVIQSWYEILEVPETAPRDQIRSAYFKKARISHPDAGGSAAEFNRIKKAYEEGIKRV